MVDSQLLVVYQQTDHGGFRDIYPTRTMKIVTYVNISSIPT